jgi:hypothetical protein
MMILTLKLIYRSAKKYYNIYKSNKRKIEHEELKLKKEVDRKAATDGV